MTGGTRRGGGDMAEFVDGATSEQVRRSLEGVRFPALKHDVVHAARRNQAPNEIVAVLERVPITEFKSADEVVEAYGATAYDKLEDAPSGRPVGPLLTEKHRPRTPK